MLPKSITYEFSYNCNNINITGKNLHMHHVELLQFCVDCKMASESMSTVPLLLLITTSIRVVWIDLINIVNDTKWAENRSSGGSDFFFPHGLGHCKQFHFVENSPTTKYEKQSTDLPVQVGSSAHQWLFDSLQKIFCYFIGRACKSCKLVVVFSY